MTYRQEPIVTGEVYHVFNRSVARVPIFLNSRDFQRALESIHFYSYNTPSLRFSHYNRLPLQQRLDFLKELKKRVKQVQIFAFCLMPNHFHFLVRETSEKGINNFMRNLQNSYAKYFNTKNERSGALFQAMFKSVRIETDEQLTHVARYIHLNPLTSFVIKETNDLEKYLWSSFPAYLVETKYDIVDTSLVKGLFPSLESFKQFTYDQVDYQRQLHLINHIVNKLP